MAHRVDVGSADDPRLEPYAALVAHGPERAETFVVEGVLAIERLVTSTYPVHSVLVTTAQFARLGPVLDGVDAPVYVAPPDVLERVTGYHVHRGALALAWRRSGPELTDVVATARRLVVLEGSNDHENIGAIARTARALGVDALVLDPTCADPMYRRSVRVSVGEVLHLPIVRCAEWPTPLREMRAAGFETWALTPSADADDLFALPPPPRLALVAGAEGPGLTAAAQEACTRRVRIPLHHRTDSLNLGHAVAIALAVSRPVETRGIEPLTSTLQRWRSAN